MQPTTPNTATLYVSNLGPLTPKIMAVEVLKFDSHIWNLLLIAGKKEVRHSVEQRTFPSILAL